MKNKYKKVFIIKIRANKIKEESSKCKVNFTFVYFMQIDNELFVHVNFGVVIFISGILLRRFLIKDTLVKLF